MLNLEKSEKTKVYFCLSSWGHVFESSNCVIFIDRCWEASVSQSLDIRWERSHSLCASQYLDFKAIDMLFLWTNPSVLAYNPVCVELRPSSLQTRLVPDFIWLPQKRKTERRGVDNTNLMFFFLSCLPLFLVDCVSSSFIFYLTLCNPCFVSCPLIYHFPHHLPLCGCFAYPKKRQK